MYPHCSGTVCLATSTWEKLTDSPIGSIDLENLILKTSVHCRL